MKTPRPQVVLCIGLKSSGSTWLYNVAIRILKGEKARVAAFYADNFRMIPRGADKAQVLVIKSHEPSDAILFLTRFARGKVLMSVREPRDSAASLMQRFGHGFDSALRDLKAESGHLVRLAKGAMVLRYEDGFHEREETVGEVARFLGARLSPAARGRIFKALTPEAVRKTIKKLHGAKRDPDAFDRTTQWHPGHLGDGRIGKYKSVLTPAQQRRISAATRDYARAFGYLPRKK